MLKFPYGYHIDLLRKRVVEEDNNECWLWTGSLNSSGYGSSNKQLIHRYVIELTKKKKIPEGLVVDHLCMIKHCYNPRHLEVVTNGENRRRTPLKTHCHRGHEYTAETSYKDKWGRKCRICRAENNRKYNDPLYRLK